MKVLPLLIPTSESTSGPGPLVGPEVRIKKRWSLHNEPKCRFVNAPTKTEPIQKSRQGRKWRIHAAYHRRSRRTDRSRTRHEGPFKPFLMPLSFWRFPSFLFQLRGHVGNIFYCLGWDFMKSISLECPPSLVSRAEATTIFSFQDHLQKQQKQRRQKQPQGPTPHAVHRVCVWDRCLWVPCEHAQHLHRIIHPAKALKAAVIAMLAAGAKMTDYANKLRWTTEKKLSTRIQIS